MKNAELDIYIRDHRGVTPAELSAHLGVSERTIRTYVRRLNDAMRPFAQVSLKYGGYSLACEDRRAFAEWLSEGTAKWASVTGGPEGPKVDAASREDDGALSRAQGISKTLVPSS